MDFLSFVMMYRPTVQGCMHAGTPALSLGTTIVKNPCVHGGLFI